MSRRRPPLGGLLVLLACLGARALEGTAPTGLLVEFRPSPALGIEAQRPHFSWIVPHLPSLDDDGGAGNLAQEQVQVRYRVLVASSPARLSQDLGDVWAATVASNESVAVTFAGHPLDAARPYWWKVKVWTEDGQHRRRESNYSTAASFVTALWEQVDRARPLWAGNSSHGFAFLRWENSWRALAPSTSGAALAGAYAFVTGQATDGQDAAGPPNGPRLLAAYKLYIQGSLVGMGPGRGDPGARPTDAQSSIYPYDVYNVTQLLDDNHLEPWDSLVLALQCYGGRAWLQLHLHYDDGNITRIVTGAGGLGLSDDSQLRASGWHAIDGDAIFRPSGSTGGSYHQPQEHTDVAKWPSGWNLPGFSAQWPDAVEVSPFAHPLEAKRAQAVQLNSRLPVLVQCVNESRYFIDFGVEFQGGLRLSLAGNATVTVGAGTGISYSLFADAIEGLAFVLATNTGQDV